MNRKNYKERQCCFNNCKNKFEPTNPTQKYCLECTTLARKVLAKKSNKIYYDNNKE